MNPAGSTTSCGVVPAARRSGIDRFFLSLGDNLLRIFGGDRVAGLMNAFRGGRHAD